MFNFRLVPRCATTRVDRLDSRPLARLLLAAVVVVAAISADNAVAQQQVVKNLKQANDTLELTVNSSRILTMAAKIARVQVNNPNVLAVTPLSKHQVQVAAKKTGVTQINLWDDAGKIYSVDVSVYGDIRELEDTLKRLFPNASIKAFRITNSLILTGFIDEPRDVSIVMRLAEDYAPKVINHIRVGGAHQILLHVNIMEVSRTKLRSMGIDFASVSGAGDDFAISSIAGLIAAQATQTGVATGTGDTFRFGILNSGDYKFFGFIEALRQNNLMKILAEPSLATTSGRPAKFQVGGEIPILVPQSLGTVSIQYKKYGTQVDFVPIVLGNGNVRLEVRARVSELDTTRSVVIDNFTIPGLNVREVDTGVEMKSGQTFALAGLIQNRIEASNRGVPLLADIPYLGAGFRRLEETKNEIELLILVRPEYVEAMDPHQVPCNFPGGSTTSPTGWQFYMKGHIEVPNVPQTGYDSGHGSGEPVEGTPVYPREQLPVPTVTPEEQKMFQLESEATRPQWHKEFRNRSIAGGGGQAELRLQQRPLQQYNPQYRPNVRIAQQPTTGRYRAAGQSVPTQPARGTEAYNSQNRYSSAEKSSENSLTNPPGLIGPVGYDVLK